MQSEALNKYINLNDENNLHLIQPLNVYKKRINEFF